MAQIAQIVLILALFAHAVGHILFLIPATGIAKWGQTARSWLLTDLLGDLPARAIGASIWIVVICGYLYGIYLYIVGAGRWSGILVGASVLSAIGLILFWPKSQPAKSALAVDLLVILIFVLVQEPLIGTITRIF
jgi:hypothetical protein